jgi:hypothetical protein
MTDHVILFRNTGNGVIGYVSVGDENDNIATFPSREAACAAAHRVPICRAYPYQIVELDEI